MINVKSFENYNDCLWLSETIQDPKYDLLEFINLVKKYIPC